VHEESSLKEQQRGNEHIGGEKLTVGVEDGRVELHLERVERVVGRLIEEEVQREGESIEGQPEVKDLSGYTCKGERILTKESRATKIPPSCREYGRR